MDALPSEMLVLFFRRLSLTDILFGVQFVSRRFHALAWRSIDSLDFVHFPQHVGMKYLKAMKRAKSVPSLFEALWNHPVVRNPALSAGSIRHLALPYETYRKSTGFIKNLYALFPHIESFTIRYEGGYGGDGAISPPLDLGALDLFKSLRSLKLSFIPSINICSVITQLTSLVIHDFSLPSEFQQQLEDALPKCVNLKRLKAALPIASFRHCPQLSSLACYIRTNKDTEMFERLKFDNLRKLGLECTAWGSYCRLPSLKNVASTLQRLLFDGFDVTELPPMPNLRIVECVIPYCSTGWSALSESPLEQVDITVDDYAQEYPDAGNTALLDHVSVEHLRILHLDFASSGAQGDDNDIIARGIYSHRQLIDLVIAGVAILSTDRIAKELITFHHLQRFSYTLGDDISNALLESLIKFPALIKLQLSFNSANSTKLAILFEKVDYTELSLSCLVDGDTQLLITLAEVYNFLQSARNLTMFTLHRVTEYFDVALLQKSFMRCSIDITAS